MRKGGGSEAYVAEGTRRSLEIELKLGGDPAALDRGWRAAVPAGSEERAERLRSTYFDTGDFRLRRRGFTLRIHEEGERLVQTLKSEPASGTGGLFQRSEWSQPVESPVPNLAAATDPAVRDAMGLIRSAELEPAFSSDVMRRTATVEIDAPDHAKAVVEIAYDSGEIRANDRRDLDASIYLANFCLVVILCDGSVRGGY